VVIIPRRVVHGGAGAICARPTAVVPLSTARDWLSTEFAASEGTGRAGGQMVALIALAALVAGGAGAVTRGIRRRAARRGS
jgi:hypothetical protein